MPASRPDPQPAPHPAPNRAPRSNRLIATACLVVFVGLLLATPVVYRSNPYDKRIQTAEVTQAVQQNQLRESGASPEALDEHRVTSQPKLEWLRGRRRIAFFSRAAIHFGLALGFFLAWRALLQPTDGGAAASTGSKASHNV